MNKDRANMIDEILDYWKEENLVGITRSNNVRQWSDDDLICEYHLALEYFKKLDEENA